MKILLALLLLGCLLQSSVAVLPSQLLGDYCTPFGLRMFFGEYFHDPSSPEMLSIWFNTHNTCNQSFVTIQSGGSPAQNITCQSWIAGMHGLYNSNIHKCSITNLAKGEKFSYMAYGWAGQSSDSTISFARNFIEAQLPSCQNQFIMINLADWAWLKSNQIQQYSLTKSFQTLLASDVPFDALFINGDIAYNLDTNNGVNYEQFMIMLSQVSSRMPLIINPGNHAYKSPQDLVLFNASFETYGNLQKLVTYLDLGLFTFVLFNPHNILYEDAPVEPILSSLKDVISTSKKNFPTKPVIAASHYPIICSGKAKDCAGIEVTMREIYESFIDLKVLLYLGAHFHAYERLYPYIGNGKTTKIDPPYNMTSQTNYLPSLVEGIAGADHGIVDSFPEISPNTAFISYLVTGYGILTINKQKLLYGHFTNQRPQVPIDHMLINFNYGQAKQIRVDSE